MGVFKRELSTGCAVAGTVFLLGSAIGSHAGTISIRMDMRVANYLDHLEVAIEATNTGDDTALEPNASFMIFDHSTSSESIEKLDPAQSHTFTIHVPVPREKIGRYPYMGEIEYLDVSRHRFSALGGAVAEFHDSTDATLSGEVLPFELEEMGDIPIQVTNTASRARLFRVSLSVPRGLASSRRTIMASLGPGESGSYKFPILARYGLKEADYPVYFALEYDEAGVHQTALVPATVIVRNHQNWFQRTRFVWLFGVIPLVVFWIMILVFRTQGKE